MTSFISAGATYGHTSAAYIGNYLICQHLRDNRRWLVRVAFPCYLSFFEGREAYCEAGRVSPNTRAFHVEDSCFVNVAASHQTVYHAQPSPH